MEQMQSERMNSLKEMTDQLIDKAFKENDIIQVLS